MDLETLLRSVKYLRNNPKIMPRSSHIKITKPAPEAKQSVVSPSSSMSALRKTTPWSMMILFPRKRRGGG